MKLRHVLVAVLFWSSLALSLNLSVRADNPISTPANGAVEGCLNQTLFNGYWRARVTKVEQVRRKTTLSPSTGWGVYMEWTNTTTSRSPNPGVWNWSLFLPSGVGIGLRAYDDSAELSGKGPTTRSLPPKIRPASRNFFTPAMLGQV